MSRIGVPDHAPSVGQAMLTLYPAPAACKRTQGETYDTASFCCSPACSPVDRQCKRQGKAVQNGQRKVEERQ